MEQRRLIGNRYELGAVLGYGGMGTVFSGVDTYTGQTVALKQLDAQLVSSHPEVIERFEREAEALRTLDHPNIVKVLATFSELGATPGANKRYIVMEYASGGTLHDMLVEKGGLELASFFEISIDLVDALTRAHRLKIIHRDIKPANVLLAEDGTPRLSDFGIARIGGAGHDQRSRLTRVGTMLGTIDYLCPEACMGEELDARADLYSLGVMFFEMLAGQRPFSGANVTATIMAILNQPVPDIEALRPDLPAALADLIYRMLEKDREARIPSVRVVGAELEQLMNGAGAGLRAAPRSMAAAPRFETLTPQPSALPPNNLPLQIAPFVGREAELAELSRLFSDPHMRLVTILGPGGIGKTRLALESAARQLNRYERGVTFVPLARLESAADIVSAVAEACGYQFFEGGQPEEQLLDYFQQRQILLLMDNCEHLLDGIGLVGRLLSFAPQVRVLATSREKLNLQEEVCLRLEGLGFPEAEPGRDGSALEDAVKYGAIQLFLQSARRVRPGYTITAVDLPSIAHICRQVGGSPLAIMLAAAWVELLSPREIAAEIEQNLDFLVTELRDAPQRQRSMRAVFASSWKLLSEAERKTFMALSVFRGGFSRQAAQAIVGADLRTLLGFVNKSMLRRDPISARYEIHELLRQYAAERLERANKTEAVRELHGLYYTQFMEERLQAMLGPGQVKALDEIEAEYENVRRAWIWAVGYKDFTAVGRALESLFVFSDMRSREREGGELLRLARERLAPDAGQKPHSVWGRLLLPWFDLLLQSKGRPENEKEYWAQAEADLEFAEEAGDKVWTAQSLVMLGHFVDAKEAIKMYERALTLAPKMEDKFWVRIRVGFCQQKLRQYKKAIDAFQQSYERGREIGESEKMGYGLFNMGETEMLLGDYESAQNHFQAAKVHLRQVGTLWGLIWANINLSLLLLLKGEFDQARSLLGKAEDAAAEFNRSGRIKKDTLPVHGYLALVDEDYQSAETLFAESIAENAAVPEASLGLAYAACGTEDFRSAGRLLGAALQPAAPYSIPALAFLCLPAAAILSLAEDEAQRAVELLALAFTQPQSPRGMLNRWPLITRLQSGLKAGFTTEAYEKAWERGQALDLTETMAALADRYQLQDSAPPAPDQPTPAWPPTPDQRMVEPLSEREMEVLRLLKTELSGPQIARELMVSLNTVRFHTKNIYAKLQVNNRRSAVNRAIELGL